MKKSITVFVSSLIICFGFLLGGKLLADTPPDPGGDPNTGGGTPVGGSPVGGGLVILISMGTAYGIKKVYNFNNHDKKS